MCVISFRDFILRFVAFWWENAFLAESGFCLISNCFIWKKERENEEAFKTIFDRTLSSDLLDGMTK